VKSIKLTAKEINRAFSSGHTVVVRKQQDNSYMVALVSVKTFSLVSTPKPVFVEKDQISDAIADTVRWYHKLGGSEDAGSSRDRNFCR